MDDSVSPDQDTVADVDRAGQHGPVKSRASAPTLGRPALPGTMPSATFWKIQALGPITVPASTTIPCGCGRIRPPYSRAAGAIAHRRHAASTPGEHRRGKPARGPEPTVERMRQPIDERAWNPADRTADQQAQQHAARPGAAQAIGPGCVPANHRAARPGAGLAGRGPGRTRRWGFRSWQSRFGQAGAIGGGPGGCAGR